MLKPEYYDILTDDLIRLYSDLDNAIITDITRRILKTGKMTESAKWQAKQLQESGLLYDDILAEIAKRTDATENHVRTLFEDASVESVKIDNQSYRKAGLSGIITLSPAAMQVLNAGFSKCSGNLKNLTLTTAVTSQQAYITACNNAYMQVTSGAFDYNTAIRNAIKSAAVEGTHVLYPTGHRDRINVAVRRAVLTGVGQTVRKLSQTNAEDMGCDIMEITAHSGARPTHAVWQGQLVSLSGKNAGKIIEGCRVLSLKEIGYGSGDGFGGWNCRHDWYPFFVGISKRAYSDERLKELDAKNIEYNGKKYSEYEISQIQRRYEREIRVAKREQVAFKTAVQEAQDPELKAVMQDSLNYANSLVKDKQAKMRDFISQTGQFRDYSREQNYGRVNYPKNLTISKNGSIIKSLDVDDFKLMATAGGREIDMKAIDIIASTIKKYENTGSVYISDFYFGSLAAETGGRPLLQIEPFADRMFRINVNTDIFEGRTLEEINEMIASTKKNLAQNLEEAVVHECGHAKSLKGKTISQIKDFYAEIADAKINGISEIAYLDGAEALAEIEILRSRGADIPAEAIDFYNKYIKR